MKKKIIAQDKEHFKELLMAEMHFHGKNCDLNHIDMSKITNMDSLFYLSSFNGDISKWDTSHVTSMRHMFHSSKFDGDISNWNVSNVENMDHMFLKSHFNGDISKWDVSNVLMMEEMFSCSKFNGDISNWDVSNVIVMANMFSGMIDKYTEFNQNLNNWKPFDLEDFNNCFMYSVCEKPYWAEIKTKNKNERMMAIKAYHLEQGIIKELSEELKIHKNLNNTDKKMKI